MWIICYRIVIIYKSVSLEKQELNICQSFLHVLLIYIVYIHTLMTMSKDNFIFNKWVLICYLWNSYMSNLSLGADLFEEMCRGKKSWLTHEPEAENKYLIPCYNNQSWGGFSHCWLPSSLTTNIFLYCSQDGLKIVVFHLWDSLPWTVCALWANSNAFHTRHGYRKSFFSNH